MIRTEYSLGRAFGKVADVVALLKEQDHAQAIIADENGTWGHVAFMKACKKAGIEPGFGVRLLFTRDPREKGKSANGSARIGLVARTEAGLAEIYNLVTRATHPDFFFYEPRLPLSVLEEITDNVHVLIRDNKYLDELRPQTHWLAHVTPFTTTRLLKWASRNWLQTYASSDNFYPRREDRHTWQMFAGRNASDRPSPQWILSPDELPTGHLTQLEVVSSIPKAEMRTFPAALDLFEECVAGAARKGVNLSDPIYSTRLEREVSLIEAKGFTNYFFIIADMVREAKARMLVGPGRGSSAGSLVCYLLDITTVDPIPYGLLFERFIDINRNDLPDIDIDFADDKRDSIIDYMRVKYGAEHVARIGSVNRLMAKSAIGSAGKACSLDYNKMNQLKKLVPEAMPGDELFGRTIRKTLDEHPALDVPMVSYACELEGHASHAGQHAAGIAVTERPVSDYCSVDLRNHCSMVDKKDAEELDILKIDALGLRTLTVIDEALALIGKPREWIYSIPFDDPATIGVFNSKRYAGIFQFEGAALQGFASQCEIERFEEIAALTAVARPGPIGGGAAQRFVRRLMGHDPVEYDHPLLEPITRETYGLFIYQEQVMFAVREIGGFSWEDTIAFRRVIGKKEGNEAIERFRTAFVEGATARGVPYITADLIFDQMITFGTYAFNKSHSVAYGVISYWCAFLKANFPNEFYLATLRNAKDADQVVAIIRESGLPYVTFDFERSDESWTLQDGTLVGGFMNIEGIGPAKAKLLIRKRSTGAKLTDAEQRLVKNAVTPFDKINECAEMWKEIFDDPEENGIVEIKSRLSKIAELETTTFGDVVFIAKVIEKTERNLNDPHLVASRGSKIDKGPVKYLNLTLQDDTGTIYASINVKRFDEMAPAILREHSIGDYYLFKGWMGGENRKVYLNRYKYLGVKKHETRDPADTELQDGADEASERRVE